MTSDCDNCRNTCGYPRRDWYPRYLVERHYCRVMMIFVLENIVVIRDGTYPQDSTPTGYTNVDPEIRTKPQLTDSKELVMQLAAEIDARLYGWYKYVKGEKVKVTGCGIAGKLLEAQAQNQKEIWELDPEAREALNYIAGKKRKLQSFVVWKADIKRKTASKKP